MIDTIYLVFGKTYWGRPKVERATRKRPNLKPDQVAVRLNLDIPHEIFNPPTVALAVSDKNVIRPVPQITQP